MSNFQWTAGQLQLNDSQDRNSLADINSSIEQQSKLQGSYYSNRDKKTHYIHGMNSQKQLVIAKKHQLTFASKTPQASNQQQTINLRPSSRNDAPNPADRFQINNQKLTMTDEEHNAAMMTHPHLHTIINEDSNGSRERFMIHRRMSNTGIINISTINANATGNPTLKRRNIQATSEGHHQQYSSADKQSSKNRFQVSPYSVKNNVTKFPPSQTQLSNQIPKNQSYNYSESKQGKKIMHIVSGGVPQVADMIPPHHIQDPANNNLSSLTRSVGIVNNTQQVNDAKYKSGTTIANNNAGGGGAGLSELKQHFPPLDPKAATSDQIQQQSNMKKKYVKNGFGSTQDIVLFSAGNNNNNANSFVETSPVPINIKKVGSDQFDQGFSEDQQQVLSNPNRFYPSHDSQSKSGQYFLQDEARVIMTKSDMKNSRQVFNKTAQQPPYATTLQHQQQQSLQMVNSSNDLMMKKNQSIIKKQVIDTKKIKNYNANQSPAGMSRNLVQSQNLMLASPGGSGSILSPPNQQQQQRPHESHSHTRSNKLRYNHPQIKAQYIKRSGAGVPPPVPNRGFGSSIVDQKGFPQQQYGYHNQHQYEQSLQYRADNSNNHRDSLMQMAANRGEPLNSDGTLMLPQARNSDNFTTGDQNNFENPPESFTERFSSIDQDELENTIKIGRGGEGDMEEDIKLFRDIEIRLKIEPLTIKLIHNITERIRAHVHGQGKLALSNLVGLLYQQFVKLSQRLSISPPSNVNNGGGSSANSINQLQAINQDLNAEIDALHAEIRQMKQGRGGFPDQLGDLNSSPKTNLQVQELRRRNFELQSELEQMKERLAIYENQNGESDQLQSLENTLNNNQSPIIKKQRGQLVPKLNLQKALQFNMKLFKPANLNNMSIQHQFQAPLESSNRGSYMSFKLQQFPVGDNEGIPVAQASLDQQPLVRPTTTMGGRKKLVQSNNNNNVKNTSNEEIMSEVSGGREFGNSPQMESMPRPAMKQLKFKKLGTQHGIDESGNSNTIPNINLQPINNKPTTAVGNQGPSMHMSMKKLPGKVKGFHDEFMDKYDEFSLSWREAIDREKRF